ncbi:hypothetical protein FWK35_00029218 [Aphis craccivora]|nr:hypothetical protein FWK35_00029218 [Aphis craccivora]
MYTRTC